MTRRSLLFSTAAVAVGASSAQTTGAPSTSNIVLSWNFTLGSQGWLAGYSDYRLGMGGLDRVAELRILPPEIGIAGHLGYYVQGHNRSDDLFMYLKKQIGPEQGIQPNQWYRPSMHIQVASKAPSNCFGVGGAPGEAVYLKAGVTQTEPTTTLVDGQVLLNLDKGFQSAGGADLKLVSNVANGTPCELPVPERYVMLEKVLYQDNNVQADAHGNLWVTVGTDSGFEGLTGLYYYTVGVVLVPVPGITAK